jgi:formylglycine-generating enzyme required for sulfatase activity/nucleoid-associated protein YgaU
MTARCTVFCVAITVLAGLTPVSRVSAGDDPPTSQPAAAPTAPKADETLSLDCGDGVKMELALIPAGSFTMGSNDGADNEKPPRTVTISKPFYIGKREVTQKQWKAVIGENPSRFKGNDLPVENVSWDDCQKFCTKLSAKTGKVIRLPTEAEWEYACRAGSTGKYCFGDLKEGLEGYAWYDMNSALSTHPVGRKRPNAWGLHDMHGNAWEWCADRAGEHGSEEVADTDTPSSGGLRVLRGGSWTCDARLCMATGRLDDRPSARNSMFGLRVAAGESSVEQEDSAPSPKRAPARQFAPRDAGSRRYDVASTQRSSQLAPQVATTTAPSVLEHASEPTRAQTVTIKLSGPRVSRAPYWVGCSVDLPRSVTRGADFLWMDNGVWVGDEPLVMRVFETPGLHEITVLMIASNNDEYRGSAVLTVVSSGGQAGEDHSPSTQPTDASQHNAIGSGARTHVVEPGDTLASISEKYYGHSKLYGKILAANRNRLEDPNNLPVGMKLIIRP